MIANTNHNKTDRHLWPMVAILFALLSLIAGTPAWALAQGPTVTIDQATGQVDPAFNGPILFDVVFSAPVTGFTAADVALSGLGSTNAVVSVSGSGATYTVSVTGMTNTGSVFAFISAGAAMDSGSGLSQTATSTDNIVNFFAGPSVTINQGVAQADPAASGPVVFDVVFSKPVTGFNTNSVTFGGTAIPSLVNISGSGANYTVSLSGMQNNGTVFASVQANVVTDANGNINAASTSTDNTVNFILTPTVTINQQSQQPDPAAFGPISFDVSFSAPVTGFTSAGVALSGTAGATTASVSGIGADYTVTVTGMTQSGTVIADVLAGSAANAANVANPASTSIDNVVTFNKAPLTVSVSKPVGQNDPSGNNAIYFAVVFSAPVTGFDVSDVTVAGTAGAAPVAVSGSGAYYQVQASGMTQTGTVVVSISPNAAIDANNTSNLSSNGGVITYYTNPTVTIDQAANQTDPATAGPIQFTVVFDHPVLGLGNGSVVTGGTASPKVLTVTGSGTTYTLSYSGFPQGGTIIPTIGANAAVDAVNKVNLASTSTDNSVTYTPDPNAAPTVTVDQTPGFADPTSGPILFQAVFSKPVSNFSSSGVVISGTAGATTAVVTDVNQGVVYSIAVSGMTQAGTVIVDIPANAAQDSNNSQSAASTSTDNVVTYFIPGSPTVTINQGSAQADPSATGPVVFDAVFSAPVTGFDATDITLAGTAGATTATVTGSGTAYAVSVSGMTQAGAVIVSIPANAAIDAGSLPNQASTSTDNTVNYAPIANPPPTVTINQSANQTDPAGAGPIAYDVVFSAQVTGFSSADVALSGTAGATSAAVTGNGATYLVTVSGMTQAGTVIASINAGAAMDTASIASLASTSTDNTVTFAALTQTATTLTSSLNPSLMGQSVTLSATVAPTQATGTVAFNDGAAVLCAAAPVANGVATCAASFAISGPHALDAVYSGDATYASSTSLVLQQAVSDPTAQTTAAIGEFIGERNEQLLASGPDDGRQIERLTDAGAADGAATGTGFASNAGFAQPLGVPSTSLAAAFANVFSAPDISNNGAAGPFNLTGGTDGAAHYNFSTSLSKILRYSADAEARKVSGLGIVGLPDQGLANRFNPFDIWIEGKYADLRSGGDLGGHFGLVSVGADYVLNPSLLLGAMVQFDTMRLHSDSKLTDASGSGWMAGPYATLKLSDHVFLQTRAAWGKSSNEVSPFLTYTDGFGSTRWLVSSSLTGNWRAGLWSLRPSASVAYMEDTAESYVDTFGAAIPSVTSQLGQAKAGPEISYRFQLGGGVTVEPNGGLQVIWDFARDTSATGLGSINGSAAGQAAIRGKADIGLRATTVGGISVDLSGSYDGIGSSGVQTVTGKAVVRVPLN